ncbi:MAG: hypothetical protein NDI60_11505 [Elusimicrobiales bacterium]|nr:hypothetical protein [Elusimicrobiales bacterium]
MTSLTCAAAGVQAAPPPVRKGAAKDVKATTEPEARGLPVLAEKAQPEAEGAGAAEDGTPAETTTEVQAGEETEEPAAPGGGAGLSQGEKIEGAEAAGAPAAKTSAAALPKAEGSLGGGLGAGVACKDSIPALAGVKSEPLPSWDWLSGRVVYFSLKPNEALSYKFTAPDKGYIRFVTQEATNARQVNLLISVSETPCDFDARKAAANVRGKCHAMMKFPQVDAVISGAVDGCRLQAGKTYYFNIRTYLDNPVRDACAAELPFFRSVNQQPLCGGIFAAKYYK